jgi:hypothetical protein
LRLWYREAWQKSTPSPRPPTISASAAPPSIFKPHIIFLTPQLPLSPDHEEVSIDRYLLGLWLIKPVHAAEFFCDAGNVTCLIDAINTANLNNEENMIKLAAGIDKRQVYEKRCE